jgi:hypothetical protein
MSLRFGDWVSLDEAADRYGFAVKRESPLLVSAVRGFGVFARRTKALLQGLQIAVIPSRKRQFHSWFDQQREGIEENRRRISNHDGLHPKSRER